MTYDPIVGRFTTLDPYEGSSSEPLSLHKYLYVNGDPINNIDPTGEFGIAVGSVGSLLAGGIVGASYGGILGGLLGTIYAIQNGYIGMASDRVDLEGFYRSVGMHQARWSIAGMALGGLFGATGAAGMLGILAGGGGLTAYKYLTGPEGTTLDDVFASMPWAPYGLLPSQHIKMNKGLINGNGFVPPELLGSVLLAELNAFNVFDEFFDDFQFETTHSIGITQTRVDSVQKWGLMPGASVPQIHNALMEPGTAITLLARQLDYFARQAGPGIQAQLQNWNALSANVKQNLVRKFTSAKDLGVLGNTGFGEDEVRVFQELRSGNYL